VTEINPYDVLIAPALLSEKVLNARDKLSPGYAEQYKEATRKELEEMRAQIGADESLTAEEKRKAIRKETRRALHKRKPTRRVMNTNQNKVIFRVRDNATKPQIKRAVEQIYKVKVVHVNTLHTKRGKQAIVKLSDSDVAEDIYNRLGQI
jgi:large subunit ribosomal protein L23